MGRMGLVGHEDGAVGRVGRAGDEEGRAEEQEVGQEVAEGRTVLAVAAQAVAAACRKEEI